MKHNKHTQNQNTASTAPAYPAADASPDEINFAPSPDEVARAAYFSYVNQGSRPGHEVQHWLAAERNRTRVHGFHNKT
jgi:hypothetical protein